MTEDQFDAAHDAYQDVYDGGNHQTALKHAVLAATKVMRARLEAEIVTLKDDVDTIASWWKEAKAEADALKATLKTGRGSQITHPLVIDEPGYCNSRDVVVKVLLKDADEVERAGFIAKASCYRSAAATLSTLKPEGEQINTDPFDQDWLKECATKADGFEDGLRAAARIVDAYGKAAHDQSLRDMAPVISKSILRPIEAAALKSEQPCELCGSTDGCDGDLPSLRHCPKATAEGEQISGDALWRVLMDEKLNDGHYIKAFDLIEKLYSALSTVKAPAEVVSYEHRRKYSDGTCGEWIKCDKLTFNASRLEGRFFETHTTLTPMRTDGEVREAALTDIVRAWEALPGGQQQPMRAVEKWLADEMAPSINRIRALLKEGGAAK